MRQTVFLLSPAHCGGRRARILLNPAATFALAQELRAPEGAPLGKLFAFMSGLYFRGKLAYAEAFGRGVESGAYVITAGLGLVDPARRIGRDELVTMAEIDVSLAEPRYREPLERDAQALAGRLGADDVVVLLGSIASDKYVGILETALGHRLQFPSEFVGRGDMSRGGLLLRCAVDGNELTYVPLAGAVRHGPRPPKLEPRRYGAAAPSR